ncbi:MAG TPA: LON peptidase substrate-binding domain-containing protein [Dermatophilaceae bacterium]|nr:LON peptidase substrate-binding domain-containing protein [Dermatophilaceae bacterium]
MDLRELLPLFPLGAVLYPGVLLPLHIFEQRYRDLVKALVELPGGAPREFGVIAIRSGREVGAAGVAALYPVGCTAVLATVSPLPDGRFDIVCIGSRRFELLGVEPAGTSYLTGSVRRLDDPDGHGATDLAASVARDLERYRQLIGISGDEPDPTDPRQLSYQVASTLRLDLAERQALLQSPDNAARLRAERALLRRELGLVRALGAVPALGLSRAAYTLN